MRLTGPLACLFVGTIAILAACRDKPDRSPQILATVAKDLPIGTTRDTVRAYFQPAPFGEEQMGDDGGAILVLIRNVRVETPVGWHLRLRFEFDNNGRLNQMKATTDATGP